MCGLTGIWSPASLSGDQWTHLRTATTGMRRRGPDNEGFAKFDCAAFGHRRLSIIDVDNRSHQPMTSECGRYVLVFNGEIYNFKTLRTEMEGRGEVFRTSGDTEVLLRGLMLRGRSFLEDLNGFFAFAYYDKQRNELLLARDRYGIKPLYHAFHGDAFYFSSTLEGLMDMGIPRVINPEALAVYLQLSYIPAPMSILKNAYKALPGQWIQISESGVEKGLYYALDTGENPVRTSSEPVTNHLKKLLEESVRARLMADVPVGAFLSGGIDSAVITSLAVRAGAKPPTFSIGFPDLPYFDESAGAAATARHLGLEHHVHQIRESDLGEHPEKFLDVFDEPFADSSAVLVNLLSEFVSDHVKVALSGDGADEIFGGYNKHRALMHSMRRGTMNQTIRRAHPLLNMLPASRNRSLGNGFRKLQRYGRGLGLSFQDRYWEWACFTYPADVAALLGGKIPERPDFIQSMLATLDPGDFNTVLRADMQLVLANDMLYKVDRMSMHHGLEVRVPFLDHRMVDYVFSLPASIKLDGKIGKRILRETFAGQFPRGHFSSRKKGFEAPLNHWFKGPLRELTEELLNTERVADEGYFDAAGVAAVRTRVGSRSPGDSPHTLWALLVFQYWKAKYIDQTIP